jgi:predicted aspartyl protease
MFKIVAICLSLLSLTGCNVVNHLKLRYANDDLVASWPQSQIEVDLPTHYLGEKPYVEVSINGQDGFIFLIDTGASITYLMDTPKIASLKLSQGFSFEVGGWGDEQNTQAYQTHLQTLSLSGVSFTEVSSAFVPVSKSLYFLRDDEAVFDGVLGHDILRHFNWKFDKSSNRISIRSESYPDSSKAVAVDIDVFMSKLYIDLEVVIDSDNKFEHEVIIDTGSRHYFKLNQTYLNENDIKLSQKTVTAADFGMSGRAEHQRTTLPEININGQLYHNVRTNLIKTDESDEFWVIGSALLNQSVSVIDYQQNKLFIYPFEEQEFRSRYNLLGLEVRKIQSGEFVIRYVMPELATADLDFKVGDLITSIDSVSIKSMTKDKWLALSSTANSYNICRMRDTEQCFDVVSKDILGYSVPAKLTH